MNACVDNDLMLKGAAYGLLREMLERFGSGPGAVGVVATARYVVRKRIERLGSSDIRARASAEFEVVLSRAEVLEPTESERAFAARLEVCAQESGLALDVGESQLCAIAVSRMVGTLLTGDKRAICAIESLLDTFQELQWLSGRVSCLEQAIDLLVERGDFEFVRGGICSSPDVDTALSICFQCRTGSSNLTQTISGLRSYINHLRATAGRVLSA